MTNVVLLDASPPPAGHDAEVVPKPLRTAVAHLQRAVDLADAAPAVMVSTTALRIALHHVDEFAEEDDVLPRRSPYGAHRSRRRAIKRPKP